MSYAQSDLDTLNKAIASGARRVRYADQEVEYRSLGEMLTVRALMQQELGQAGQNQTQYQTSKGL